MRVVVVAQQKGGVGASTSVRELGRLMLGSGVLVCII